MWTSPGVSSISRCEWLESTTGWDQADEASKGIPRKNVLGLMTIWRIGGLMAHWREMMSMYSRRMEWKNSANGTTLDNPINIWRPMQKCKV